MQMLVFPQENVHFPARGLPGGARTANSSPEWPDLASEASKTPKSKRIGLASAPRWCPVGPGINVFLAGIAHFPAWGLPGGARMATCTSEWPDLAPEMPKLANMRPDLPCIHSGMVPSTFRLPRFLAWNRHVANPVSGARFGNSDVGFTILAPSEKPLRGKCAISVDKAQGITDAGTHGAPSRN